MKNLNVMQMENIQGGDTMACIQDAYTNHGWISVALFIETAFIPWAAVAIAADCAIHNL